MADIIDFPGGRRAEPQDAVGWAEETDDMSLTERLRSLSPDIDKLMREYWQCEVCASYYLQFAASRGLVCGGCGRSVDELMEDSPHDCAS